MNKSSKDIDLIISTKYQENFYTELKRAVALETGCKIQHIFQVVLSSGLNKGRKLIQFKIFIDEQQFDFDLREVQNGLTVQDDRITRDFTINSLYMWFDFTEETVHVDYPPNGKEDIAERKIRTTNGIDHTFQDASRIMRLIRFMS